MYNDNVIKKGYKMKVTICDPCKKFDSKTTETLRYLKVKGKPFLRVDVRDEHNKEVNKLSMPDYVRYSFKLSGIDLSDKTDNEIKEQYLRG